MKRFHSYLLAVTLLLAGRAAEADVVSPEPSSCPAGSQPSTCHGGPHCAALTCQTDGDCDNGLSCREVSACIGKVNCAGLIGPGEDPSMYDRDTLEGRCESNAACPSDSTCRATRLCLSPEGAGGSGGGDVVTQPVGESGDDGGCSCRMATSRTPLAGVGVLSLFSVALLARWRNPHRRVGVRAR